MTDLAALRGPRLMPPAGGLDRALASGHRRLRRRRVTSAAAATACLALLAVATLSRGATSSLDRLEPAVTPPPTATPGVPGTTFPPAPAGVYGGHAVAPPASGAGAGGVSSPLPTAAATPTARPPRPSQPPPRWVGHALGGVEVKTTYDDTACTPVTFASQVAMAGYCYWFRGPAEVVPGNVYNFSYTLCHQPGVATGLLDFETKEEVSLVADGTLETVWRFGSPGTLDEHTVEFSPGECRTWHVLWKGEDADGYAVPRGTYDMTASLTVMDGSRPSPWPRAQTVYVTVR
ncbi:MAG TPA: hypothetical protein VF519_14655 [Mycobacteriales bacterium]|jgi:hypothetical protein